MAKKYDGYHFCEDTSVGLFNPFSLLNVFQKLKFGNFWFQTGTPTYLVDLLKKSDYDLRLLLNGVEVTASAFSEYRAEANNPLPMIYQSGYLTIKAYDKRFAFIRFNFRMMKFVMVSSIFWFLFILKLLMMKLVSTSLNSCVN